MDIFFLAAQAQPYPNPLGDIKTVLDLIKAIAQAVFYFALPVGTLALIILGLQMVFSSGNPSKLEDTKKKFLWVLIGTALLVAASLFAQAIINYIQHPTVNGFYDDFRNSNYG